MPASRKPRLARLSAVAPARPRAEVPFSTVTRTSEGGTVGPGRRAAGSAESCAIAENSCWSPGTSSTCAGAGGYGWVSASMNCTFWLDSPRKLCAIWNMSSWVSPASVA